MNTDRPHPGHETQKLPTPPISNQASIGGTIMIITESEGTPDAVRTIESPHMIASNATTVAIMNRRPRL